MPHPLVIHHRNRVKGDVYIGRPSIWGNKFFPSPSRPKAKCIELYRAWLLTQPHLLARLPELKGKRLVCWCAPDHCHGDVLAELANTPAGVTIPPPQSSKGA